MTHSALSLRKDAIRCMGSIDPLAASRNMKMNVFFIRE